jgi:ribonuclease D
MTDFDWVDSQRGFTQLLAELSDSETYALDTEFHRERTYWPQLGIVQVAMRKRIALVDALAVDVEPLGRAFETSALCVMHAASQDLEILELACGTVPSRLFDTQIAALFCGYGISSLAKLVEVFTRVRLDKSAQLTDWTRRPLSRADLDYAASDVAHLLDLRVALNDRLEQRGRVSWAEEEMERLRSKDRSLPNPETLWWKLRGKTKLNGNARGVAQELVAWREEVARRENRPARAVLSDLAILALAQRPARNAAQLRGVRNLDLRRFKHSEELIAAVNRGTELPNSAIRLPPARPENLPSLDGVIALCLAWLAQRAVQEGIDQSVLGTREDVTNLVLRQPSRLSDGWREALVGRELRAIIEGAAVLRVTGTELELCDRMLR